MVKAFFGAFLLIFGLVAWVTLPRAIKRTCPVCQGRGTLEANKQILVAKGKDWVERKELLCPFCVEGKISLYDLKAQRSNMIRWMVKEQKLEPELLVKRIEAGFGADGLKEWHEMAGNDKNLPGGKK